MLRRIAKYIVPGILWGVVIVFIFSAGEARAQGDPRWWWLLLVYSG